MPKRISHKSILALCSLRWHYPNQVTGQSNTAYSQPASCKLPFLRSTFYHRKDTFVNPANSLCLGSNYEYFKILYQKI